MDVIVESLVRNEKAVGGRRGHLPALPMTVEVHCLGSPLNGSFGSVALDGFRDLIVDCLDFEC